MVADKTVVFRDSNPNKISATSAFLLAALSQGIYNNIVDFGGACGAHYFEIRKFLTHPVKWIVVETPQMVSSAKSRKLETDELIFVDSLDYLPQIDFIHSSGTLQSVPDAYGTLQKLMNLGAKNILFNRMMFNKNDREFTTVQKSKLADNGKGKLPDGYIDKEISYPHTTLSFNKFNSFLSNKYSLTWEFDEPSGSYQIGNDPIIGCGMFYTMKING